MEEFRSKKQKREEQLAWQSRIVVTIVLAGAAGYFLPLLLHGSGHSIWLPLAVSLLFGALVLGLRAATPAAALLGAVLTLQLTSLWCLGDPHSSQAELLLHSPLPAILTLFLLTFAATRIGRRRKEQLGLAEAHHGRTAAQIAANLGPAALATVGIHLWNLYGRWNSPQDPRTNMIPFLLIGTGIAAALGEATADTLSSELGQALGGEPRMMTTLQPAPRGSDGAITLTGTLFGVLGAYAVLSVTVWACFNSYGVELLIPPFSAAVLGFLIDSLLGATLESADKLNNDAVNFLSGLAAMLAGVAMVALLTWR